MTVFDLGRLADIKRRQAARTSDVVQLRTDVDELVGWLEEAHQNIKDLRRALGDIEILASDTRSSAYATEQLARMARTNRNDPVPAGGGGR